MARFPLHAGQRVLEVGCGIGTDAIQFARAGADVTAIDLSEESLSIARCRFAIEGREARLILSDAEHLPFPDNSFDFAYSHGVLHHTPSPNIAVKEIFRVLRPGASALVMLYNRNSYNFRIDINVIRRAGWHLLKWGVSPSILSNVTGFDRKILESHKEDAMRRPHFDRVEFLNNNTDGPGNPLSRVFSRSEAKQMFDMFTDVRTTVRFFDRRHVPVVGRFTPTSIAAGLGRLAGWHLYIRATKPH
jgi:SAM-dependent methyltransferase